jgi:hypothetical protein
MDNGGTTGVDAKMINDTNDGGITGVDDGGTTGVDAEAEMVTNHGKTTGVDAEAAEAADDHTQTALERKMEDKYGPRTEQCNMRQQVAPDYSHLFANTDEDGPLATPQMSMKKGLKVFGEDAVKAVKKEMLQLHEQKSDGAKACYQVNSGTETGGPSLPDVPKLEKVR